MSETGGFCTLCGLHVDSFEGLAKCPRCGHSGAPCADADQVDVAINIHELRILCIWAELWALSTEANESIVYGIAHRLRQQLPDAATPLTLSDELEGLRRAGYSVDWSGE